MGPAFGRHAPRCAPRAPVALSCPPIRLSVSRVAASGGELAAPWPSCAPLRPVRARGVPRPARREGRRPGCVPRSTARGVPAASRPAMGPAPMPLWGKRRPQRRGPPAAAPPPLPPWALVRALPAARPARHRCSRACGLATTAVRCDCMQSHLPAVTCLLPAPLHLAATCSLQFSARARLSRVAAFAGDP